MKKKILFFLLCLCPLCLFSVTVTITQDANIRELPNKDAAIVAVAKGNEKLDGEISSENANWYKVVKDGQTGYVHKSLVKEGNIDISSEDEISGIVIVALVIGIILILVSLKIPMLNKIVVLLFNVARLILVFLCIGEAISLSDGNAMLIFS